MRDDDDDDDDDEDDGASRVFGEFENHTRHRK